jgi:rare lipoprotein A
MALLAFALPRRACAEVATWYAREPHHQTSSGEYFDPEALTCASRDFGYRTILQVSWRGRSVYCRVNNYGPSLKSGSDLNLSRGAARRLHMLRAGRATVDVLVVVRVIEERLE